MDAITYTPDQLAAIKEKVQDICREVADLNPEAWRRAHSGQHGSGDYNDLCVQALRAAGIFAGRNGKRGGLDLSEDVLAFGLTTGGAEDKSLRHPRMAIIDYISQAGTASAAVGWMDVSAPAPGRFMDPKGVAGILPGVKNDQPSPEDKTDDTGTGNNRLSLPPDAELADFVGRLERAYAVPMGREPRQTSVDLVGYGRWGWAYQDLRAAGNGHDTAVREVMAQISAIVGLAVEPE